MFLVMKKTQHIQVLPSMTKQKQPELEMNSCTEKPPHSLVVSKLQRLSVSGMRTASPARHGL